MMDHSRLWDYDLLEELGKGEYGSVYKVHNKKNNRIYALKKINISSCHVLNC
jgi:serine/threonine protein kinase